MSISGDRRRAGEIQQLVGRPGRRSNGGRLGAAGLDFGAEAGAVRARKLERLHRPRNSPHSVGNRRFR